MEKLGYDNMLEIPRRLIEDKNKKELIRYKCVSKLWHNVISDILIRIIWPQTPVVGIYLRIMRAPPFVSYIVSRLSPTTCTVSERQLLKTHMLSNCNEYTKTIFIPMTWDHGDNTFDSNNSVFIDCCNGLLYLFHFKYDTYYVSNPYTRQRAHIPKPPHHHYVKDNILCAALAFDPAESSFYKVVIIISGGGDDFEVIDIFSSSTGKWNRTILKLNPFFFRDSYSRYNVSRVYSRGVLYKISSSSKVSCIDINNSINPYDRNPIDLPPRLPPTTTKDNDDSMKLEDVDWDVLGCLGVVSSMSSAASTCLSHCKRDWATFGVWLYHDDDESSNKWIPTYSVSFDHQRNLMTTLHVYQNRDANLLWMEPYAIGPNPCVMYFGSDIVTSRYNFNTNELQTVHTIFYRGNYLSLGPFSPFFTFRNCLIPFQGLNNERNAI